MQTSQNPENSIVFLLTSLLTSLLTIFINYIN